MSTILPLYQITMTMTGFSAIQSYQVAARPRASSHNPRLRRRRRRVKCKAVGRCYQLPRRARRNPIGTDQAQWPYVKLEVPEVDRVTHQEAAIPAIGERDCPRPGEEGRSIPEWGHYSAPRGLEGIPGRPPRGLQPVCHPFEEGHNHAKRHSVGTPHQRREELKQP